MNYFPVKQIKEKANYSDKIFVIHSSSFGVPKELSESGCTDTSHPLFPHMDYRQSNVLQSSQIKNLTLNQIARAVPNNF